MSDLVRLLLVLALAGAALTLMGGAAIWFTEETRRLKRGLKRVLQGEPHAMLAARGSGRGVGFNFTSNMLAVAWDAGAWCLLYRVDELIGAELIVDGQVVARAHSGETRRALDTVKGAEEQVRLRLVFNDAAHPDFDLDLWSSDGKTGKITSAQAIQEGNRWIARTEALLRRAPPPIRPAAPVATPPQRQPEPLAAPREPPPVQRPEPPLPLFDHTDEPPWDEDDDADELDERP